MTLEGIERVADLAAELTAVGPVRGEVFALQVLLAAVPAPRHLGAERADNRAIGPAHQVPVSQLIQPRVHTCGTIHHHRSNQQEHTNNNKHELRKKTARYPDPATISVLVRYTMRLQIKMATVFNISVFY